MAGNKSIRFVCAVLSLVVATEALQNSKVIEAWNPFGAFGSNKDDASTADPKAELQEVPDDAKDEIKSVSKEDDNDNDHETEEVNEKGEALPKPAGDPVPPRMLVTAGCDGSGAILKHAHNILMLHGIQTPAVNKSKLAADYGDIAQDGPGMSGSSRVMAQMHKDFLEQKQTLLFKGTIGTDDEEILSKSLFALSTKVVEVTRRNQIDQVVCMIKDCFGTHMGHPVMAGEKSDLCMERRKENPENYKAFVNAETLVRNIKTLQDNVLQTTNDLQKIGYSVKAFDAEDLLDFEWDEDKINTALPNWKRLLTAWGVHPSKTKIRAYLTEHAGARAAPQNHTDTIYNFGSVKGAVTGNDGLTTMLRD